MAHSGEGTVWYQRTISVTPRSRGCHYITDDIIKGMPEITQIKIGTLNLFSEFIPLLLFIALTVFIWGCKGELFIGRKANLRSKVL